MNDDFLNRHRRAPRPQFAARLYERIAEPMQTSNQHPAAPGPRRAGRWLATSTLLAGALFAVVLFPPARAFADGVIHQIGGYVFVQSPPEPKDKIDPKQNDVKNGGPAADDATKQAGISAPPADKPAEVTKAEASQQAGFSVLSPSYLPAGLPAEASFMVDSQDEGVSVMTAFVDHDQHLGIKLVEFKLAAGHAPLPLYWPEAVDVTVRGQPGLWLPGGTASLIWEENGITLSLIGDNLSQAELMKVAEGLR